MKIQILDLSIQESYFVGHCEFDNKVCSFNIQNGSNIAKFPFEYNYDEVMIKFSGKTFIIHDVLKFKGNSEWIEIYSDRITNYLANHQEELNALEFLPIN